MKKITTLLILLAISIHDSPADSVFQQLYLESERYQAIGDYVILGGAITALSGLILFLNSTDSALSSRVIRASIGGLGSGAFISGIIASSRAEKLYQRMAYAMIYETQFSEEEIDAIFNQDVYFGMSEIALLASWGEPKTIICSSTRDGVRKQYIYDRGQKYIHVENGQVTSWKE